MHVLHIILAVLAIALLTIGAWFVTGGLIDTPAQPAPVTVLSFADCAAAGYPIMESYPRQCRTPDGRTYAEELPPPPATYVNASADLIAVDTPAPGSVTGKTFTIAGKARGNWYFEASFPIELHDMNGNTIATAIAQADGEWMTENFVPFQVSITAPASYIGPATLVLKKDNASGLPEHDASLSIPITVEY